MSDIVQEKCTKCSEIETWRMRSRADQSIQNAAELHTCPFNEDVHGDYETLCNCCEHCAHDCVMEI